MKTVLAILVCLASVESLLFSETPTRIAVASNFYPTLAKLGDRFARENSRANIDLIPGSSGKLYAQIVAGAPFDLFFSADAERPLLLESNPRVSVKKRHTYALGILAVVATQGHAHFETGKPFLETEIKGRIALANPKVAPFGQASIEVLKHYQLYNRLKDRLVLGENVSQPLHYIRSKAVDYAFVSYSNVLDLDLAVWLPDQKTYQPIEQQVVLLSENQIARDFLSFVLSVPAQQVIEASGYRLP